MDSLPVEAVVDAVDGVHGLRLHGDELALVLLDRRLLFVWIETLTPKRQRDESTTTPLTLPLWSGKHEQQMTQNTRDFRHLPHTCHAKGATLYGHRKYGV